MVKMWGLKQGIQRVLGVKASKKDISFFDVKQLYNQAYEEKAKARNAIRQFKKIEKRAKAMDEAYRAQLGLERRAA